MKDNKKIPERRKRYGWLVLLTIFFWGIIGAMIVWVDPENVRDLVLSGSYLMFALPLSFGIFLLLTIILLSAKRALWWTLGIMIFLYLRLTGLGNWFNLVLLLGVLTSGELYVRFTDHN